MLSNLRRSRLWLALTALTTLLHAYAQETVRVGVLHSLSGTMAISEVTVKNATLLAIEEINAKGGVLGRKVTPIVEDGASDPAVFAQKAQKRRDRLDEAERAQARPRFRRLDFGKPEGHASGL